MHHINLPNTSLSELLLRLDDRTQNVFALSSFSSRGWGDTLAWNPIAIFQYQANNPKDVLARLAAFTDEQQALGRLVIGYMSYDFGCQLHNVALKAASGDAPLIFVASFHNWITFNNTTAKIHATNPTFIDEVSRLRQRPARKLPKRAYQKTFQPTQSRSSYNKAYRKVKDYIRAGDIYQVNLAHRLEGTTQASGQDLFCLLSQTSQADFQAYIASDDLEVLSFSPERFIRVRDRFIETSPIKGTRPRGTHATDDAALREDLQHNPKDRAELDMITDLMRNDLGALCEIGSVKVVNRRVVKGYPTLWHAHSTIKGRLQSDIGAITALANLMPGGSISGCPKKRALEIINELELAPRHIYTGSIFTIKPDGTLDSNIAIRTILKKADRLSLSVGGGIVYDSTEDSEYKESIDKAASFMEVSTKPHNLSSDILEQQFGPTEIEVLAQDAATRIICTKVVASQQVLELAYVEFMKAGTDAFSAVHQNVVSGQSMGKAFRAHGIAFHRKTQATYSTTLPNNFSRRFGSHGPASVVMVSIFVGPAKIPYAKILEVYSPRVSWRDLGTKPRVKQLDPIQHFNNLLQNLSETPHL